jgi:predicted PurR-regulated permease PerM
MAPGRNAAAACAATRLPMTLTTAQRRLFAWIAIGAAALLLLWLLGPVLTPFLVGAVLAYALHPAVEALVGRRVPRVLAVVLVEVVAIVAVVALLLLLVPIVAKELPLLREQIPLLVEKLNRSVGPWLQRLGVPVTLDSEGIKDFLARVLDENAEGWIWAALSSARIGGSFLLALIGNLFIMPLVLFYLLMDWPWLLVQTQQLVPPRLRAPVERFLDECDSLLGQYLRGQLLVMLVLALYYSVGLALFGFDLAVPVGVFTGLAVFIPYLGFGLGLVLALIAAVLQFGSWYGLVAVAVVYGLGQLIETWFLTPRLVGERIGLNPLAVIFALLAFGHLFGFVGVLVALPASAVTLVALRRLRTLYVDSPLYLG